MWTLKFILINIGTINAIATWGKCEIGANTCDDDSCCNVGSGEISLCIPLNIMVTPQDLEEETLRGLPTKCKKEENSEKAKNETPEEESKDMKKKEDVVESVVKNVETPKTLDEENKKEPEKQENEIIENIEQAVKSDPAIAYVIIIVVIILILICFVLIRYKQNRFKEEQKLQMAQISPKDRRKHKSFMKKANRKDSIKSFLVRNVDAFVSASSLRKSKIRPTINDKLGEKQHAILTQNSYSKYTQSTISTYGQYDEESCIVPSLPLSDQFEKPRRSSQVILKNAKEDLKRGMIQEETEKSNSSDYYQSPKHSSNVLSQRSSKSDIYSNPEIKYSASTQDYDENDISIANKIAQEYILELLLTIQNSQSEEIKLKSQIQQNSE